MTDDSILKKANSKKSLSEEIATRKRALNFYSLANILPDPDIVLRKQVTLTFLLAFNLENQVFYLLIGKLTEA